MIGSKIRRCSARLKGTSMRVSTNARTKPSAVPMIPTSAATDRLLTSALR